MGAYKTSNESTNKLVSYFMVGALGALSASGAKSTVSDILSNMAASADVLALAKIEVEMGAIPEGESWLCRRRRGVCDGLERGGARTTRRSAQDRLGKYIPPPPEIATPPRSILPCAVVHSTACGQHARRIWTTGDIMLGRRYAASPNP